MMISPRIKHPVVFKFFIVLSLLALTAPVFGDDLKEEWYMSRGKANMKIKNYKAAIEAFEKLTEINSGNQEAMRLLGNAYEEEGLTDKAIEQYDRYLKRFPDDAEIAFKEAGFLEWSRYSYRKKDAIKYYQMGLKVQEHRENRHKLAKLLAADKKTINEAVTQYKKLLSTDPENPTLNSEYTKLLLWDDGYRKEAIHEYEKLVQKHPENFEYRHQLAMLYSKGGSHSEKAVKQYGKLVKDNPGNVDLREEYAKSLSKGGNHFSEAKNQYEIVLQKRDRLETRLAYAELLAKEKNSYDPAKEQYGKIVTQHPDRADIRLKYAKLLGAKKENLNPAIEQYKIILKKQPNNAAAHQGIADAYAWKGDNDMAIYHSRQALLYQPRDTKAASLENDLMKGREPRVYAGVTLLDQSGEEETYDVSGFKVYTGGKMDLTPFLTGSAQAGHEKYSNGEADIRGNALTVGLQYRFDPERYMDLSFTQHNFDSAKNGNEFLIQYSFKNSNFRVTPGIKRAFRYDSLLAIGGETDPETLEKIGAARTTTAFCEVLYQTGRFSAQATPYAGFVKAESAGRNSLYGAEAKAEISLLRRGPWTVSVMDMLDISHYDEDHSGFSDSATAPYPGGYYSPDIFFNNAANLQLSYSFSEDERLSFRAGPCYQFSENHTSESTSKVGANGRMEYLKKFKKAFYFSTSAQYDRIETVYHNITVTGLITYIFM